MSQKNSSHQENAKTKHKGKQKEQLQAKEEQELKASQETGKQESQSKNTRSSLQQQRYTSFCGIDQLLIIMIVIDLLLCAWTIYFCGHSFFIDFIAYYDEAESFYYGERDFYYVNSALGKWAYGPLLSYLYALLYKYNFMDDYRMHFILNTVLRQVQIYIYFQIGRLIFQNDRGKQILYCLLVLLQFNARLLWVSLLTNDIYIEIFLTLALLYYMKNQVFLGTLFYGLALASKVGPVMWLPGILLVVAKQRGILILPFFVILVGLVFMAFAKEFIDANMQGFFHAMFDYERVTNYSDAFFLSPLSDPFYQSYNKQFVLFGDILIMGFNLLFLLGSWTNWKNIFREVRLWPLSIAHQKMEPFEVARIILGSAHIAFTFSPQMHKQFYCWYAPSFPFLIAVANIKPFFKIVMMVVIDSYVSAVHATFHTIGGQDIKREEKAVMVVFNLYLLLHSFRLKRLDKNGELIKKLTHKD